MFKARFAVVLSLVWAQAAQANWVPQSFSEAFVPERLSRGFHGSFGVGSTSYLSPPGMLRQTQFSLLELEGSAASSGVFVHSAIKFQLGLGIQCPDCTAVELPEAYLESSSRLGPIQIQLGRVKKHWSILDQSWQLGVIQPRFVYDYLQPQSVGLFGFFASYESSQGALSLFASPLFIPDRGMPVSFENGMVASIDPFFRAPISEVIFENQRTPVQYIMKRPSFSELLLRPSVGATFRVGSPLHGFSINGSYAYKPMNQILLAYSALYNLSFEVADAEVYPRVLMHHVAASDLNFNSDYVSFGVSGLRELPQRDQTSATWNTQEVAPAWALSPNLEIRPSGSRGNVTKLFLSALKIWGGNANDQGPLAVTNGTAFDVRYRHTSALRAAIETPLWGGPGSLGSKMRFRSQALVDLGNSGQIYSHSLEYRVSPRWRLSVAADVLYSESRGQDFIGNNRASDRWSGGMAYVF
ncbi:MAG: hypothetical protein ACK5QT_04160 [Oligoflexia bacterium]